MLGITSANSVNLQRPAKSMRKSWRTRREAQAAAVAEIGPHAREGFEFETYKCDGRWNYRQIAQEDMKPATCAELKAMGGKKGLLSLTMSANALGGSLASHMAGALVDSGLPEKHATGLSGGVAGHSTETEAIQEAGEAVNTAALAAHEERGRERAEAEGRPYHMQSHHFAPESKMVGPDSDLLDIPEFLRRENAPESKARAAKIIHKAAERKIKHPPDTKAAKAAAKKEGRGGGTKAALIGEMLLRKNGCTTADILKATGWPSVSVPAQAKMVGLKLRKEKDGKITRYYGVPKGNYVFESLADGGA